MADDDAVKVLDKEERFPETGTYVEVTAYRVPTSDRYPEGIKYSMQYGYDDGDIIFRYDNFPDHPDAAIHHRHNSDGTVSDVAFEGLWPLYQRFKNEVSEHEN